MFSVFGISLARFGNAVWAIALREFRSRYGNRRLGFFWAFVEPCAYIVVITILMSFLHSTDSPLSIHIAPFVAMGVACFMTFNASEATVRGSLRSNKPLLSFPRIKPSSVYIGRFIAEISTLAIVYVGMFVFFLAVGWLDAPAEPHRLIFPIVLAAVYGFSVGLANASLNAMFRPWENIYSFLARFNFFTSGIFFVADGMPKNIQGFLYFQPLLHLTEWFRSGWLRTYESRFLDTSFVLWVTFCLLLFALLTERVFRKQVLSRL